MLSEKEVLVVGHFAEDFSFVMQDGFSHTIGTMLKLPVTLLFVIGLRMGCQSMCHTLQSESVWHITP